MSQSAVAIGLSAVSNASNVAVTEATIMSVLRTGDGPGAIVRALFGDCSLETLERLGAELGMTRRDLDASYATAKALHAAANAEFEEED